MTTLWYTLIFGLLAAFAASVVWALWWAMKTGQFADFQKGATSIFDADESIGRRTDGFPEEKRKSPQTDTDEGNPPP